MVVYADIEFSTLEFEALEFESANATIVKSIKQRDLLNTWLRLYAPARKTPRVERYDPSRLADELPDLVYYTVNGERELDRKSVV